MKTQAQIALMEIYNAAEQVCNQRCRAFADLVKVWPAFDKSNRSLAPEAFDAWYVTYEMMNIIDKETRARY